jgi:hypothetical protein
MNDTNTPLTHDEDVMDTTSTDDTMMNMPASNTTTDDVQDDTVPAVAIPDTTTDALADDDVSADDADEEELPLL